MRSKRAQIASVIERTGLGRAWRSLFPWRGLLILNYHRIGDAADSTGDHDLWSTSPEGFDKQLAFFTRQAEVIGAESLDVALRSRAGRYVMVTFDDGYRDNFAVALPILRRHNVPALFFLTTGFLDGTATAWWDDIAALVRTTRKNEIPPGRWFPEPIALESTDRQAVIRRLVSRYKSLPRDDAAFFVEELAAGLGVARGDVASVSSWISWEMAREMRASGMTIGAHTVTHPVLSRLPIPEQRREIAGSIERIQAQLDEPVRYFSYPVGAPDSYLPETMAAVGACGIRAAFTFNGSLARGQRDHRLALPRVPIYREMSDEIFRVLMAAPALFSRW